MFDPWEATKSPSTVTLQLLTYSVKIQQFLFLLRESTQDVYSTWRGYKSMIRPALGNKFLLLSYFCLSLQHNKQFNQLSSTRMLQIFAYYHDLASFFFIKIGIYHVIRQKCRVKHPGPMTAQMQLIVQTA